jgi:hypothetical protein
VKKREEKRWRGMMIGWSNEGLGNGRRKVRSRQKY